VRPFDDLGLVTGNCADACAIFRKEVWVKNGGYDAFMPSYGFEDWDFWIAASKNNFVFHFINEKLYYYRIVQNSMIAASFSNLPLETSLARAISSRACHKFFITTS